MKFKLQVLGSILFAISFLFINQAQAATTIKLIICMKTSDGSIAVRNATKCKKNETAISNLSQLKGDTGAAGPTGPSNLIAAMKVSSAGALVSKVLGSTTSGITPSYLGSGIYQIDISGTFEGFDATNTTVNQGKVIVLPGVVAGNNSVTDYQVVSATATSIRLWVYVFRSDSGAALTNELSIGVFQGS